MSVLEQLPKNYVYPVPRKDGSVDYKLCYTPPGATSATSRICKSMEEVARLASDANLQNAEHRQLIYTPRENPLLEALLFAYLKIMRRKARRPGVTVHMRVVMTALRRIFDSLKWRNWNDINTGELDNLFDNLVPSVFPRRKAGSERRKIEFTLSMRFLYAEYLKAFVRRFTLEGLSAIPAVLKYETVKPESDSVNTAWPIKEDEAWMKYLSQGSEILIEGDPSWSFYERLTYRPIDEDLRQRLIIMVIHLLRGRYAWRATELCRLNCEHYRSADLFIKPDFAVVKAKLKKSLLDDETAWLMDCCTVNRDAQSPLIQAFRGGRWYANYVGYYTQQHLNKAGLGHRHPYDAKYTFMTHLWEHPDLFVDSQFDTSWKRVQSVAGHSAFTDEAKKYVKVRFGSEYSPGVRNFYNQLKFLPFDVTKYPVRPRQLAASA
jgi:hypothetical protein